jgi:predicted RNase H-like HicB family nuclease
MFAMENTYTAILRQEDDWWIGWVEEVPGVNCQERTREELLVSLREGLRDILDLNREAARKGVAEDEVEETQITAAA